MPRNRPDPDQDHLAEYPERLDGHGAILVGRDGRGELRYYDPGDHVIASATTDTETVEPDWAEGRLLEPDESLADVIEEVGERLGWDALSEYAREELADDEES